MILIFCGVCFIASADRGGYVKKNKSRLNIATPANLKNSIKFNLKSGLNYRGSFFLNQKQIGNTNSTRYFRVWRKLHHSKNDF